MAKWELIGIWCRNEKVQLFSCWAYGVRDGVGRCPPSLNDAGCDLSVLLGVNSYVRGGSKFLRKFGQEHFQQNWKVEILDTVLLSNKAR